MSEDANTRNGWEKVLPILINGVKPIAPRKAIISVLKSAMFSMVHCMVYRTLETNLTSLK
jgi:hypothetical protein